VDRIDDTIPFFLLLLFGVAGGALRGLFGRGFIKETVFLFWWLRTVISLYLLICGWGIGGHPEAGVGGMMELYIMLSLSELLEAAMKWIPHSREF